MKAFKCSLSLAAIFVLLYSPALLAERALLLPAKAHLIQSPTDSRDVRMLLFFDLPKELQKKNAVVDFATLSIKAQVTNAEMGQIDVYPMTCDWKSTGAIEWKEPWTKPGGDFDSEYCQSLYSLKSDLGAKEIVIDVTGIVQAWHEGKLANNGFIVKISSDDLANFPVKVDFSQDRVSLNLRYNFEYPAQK